MSFKDFGNKIGFQLRKHKSGILAGTAIASSAAAFVLAFIKADDVKKKIEDHKARMKELHDDIDEMGEDLLPAERRRLVAAEYGKTAWEITKTIGPAAALEVVAIGSIADLYKTDRSEKAILSSALSASYASMEVIRKRIAEKYGEKAEKEIFLGEEEHEVEKVIVDEKGKEKTVKEKIKTYSPVDPYAITWGWIWGTDEKGKEIAIPTSKYVPMYESNVLKFEFLKGCLRQANDELFINKRLSLARVYDILGYEGYLKSKETIKMASMVGWVLNDEDQAGDPYVKFGFDPQKNDQQTQDFVDEKLDHMILTFNCIGDIYSEIPKQKTYMDMFNHVR